MPFAGVNLTAFLTNTLPNEIHRVVANQSDNIEDSIDCNLRALGLIFALVDALPVTKSDQNAASQRTVTSLTAIGIAGPSVIVGAMLLLYKIALVSGRTRARLRTSSRIMMAAVIRIGA